MNEERTRLWLRKTEHVHGHLWHRYSVTVNQDMVAIVKLSKWWRWLNHKKQLVHSKLATGLVTRITQRVPPFQSAWVHHRFVVGFRLFSVGHCIVYPSSVYTFSLLPPFFYQSQSMFVTFNSMCRFQDFLLLKYQNIF